MAFSRRDVLLGSAGALGTTGYFGDYTSSPTQRNGYPTDEVVMSEASTAKNGTFALAPGYI